MRKGDKLESGGELTSGSEWFEFMGRPLAGKGDATLSDEYAPTVIGERYEWFPDQVGEPGHLPSLSLFVRLQPDLVAPERQRRPISPLPEKFGAKNEFSEKVGL
jgi:hypothetical protein